MPQPRLLHVLPSFGIGGVQVRTAQVLNHLGDRYGHSIVALDGDLSCRRRLASGLEIDFVTFGKTLGSLVGRIGHMRSFMRACGADLLLTYNWGAIEWAFANTLSPILPHIHYEDGFGVEEAEHQLTRRVLFRRLALARCHRTVVPSKALQAIALQTWRVPESKVAYIPNGIFLNEFDASTKGTGPEIAGLNAAEVCIGTLAPLRPEKDIGLLIEAFAALPRDLTAKLVIAGEGSEREMLEAKARDLSLDNRVVFTGQVDAIAALLSKLDVFVLTSKTEQMPLTILQAMAAGKAVVSVDVGDVKDMLSAANRSFVVSERNPEAVTTALETLCRNVERRDQIGKANRQRVAQDFPGGAMFEAHSALIKGAVAKACSTRECGA